MGYHATTMGNHDFDNGIDHLANMLALHPKIPMVNCNYSLKNTRLYPFVKQKIVVEINHKRIGITGVGINPDNLIMERLIPGLIYNDPVAAVQKQWMNSIPSIGVIWFLCFHTLVINTIAIKSTISNWDNKPMV